MTEENDPDLLENMGHILPVPFPRESRLTRCPLKRFSASTSFCAL